MRPIQTQLTAVYTLGYSNRSLEEFLEILQAKDIKTLVDVRAYPQSSRYPHFAGTALRGAMEAASIDYHFAGRHLGAMRKPRTDSIHFALTQEGQRGYADHMESDAFKTAARQLTGLAQSAPTTILCAEREPGQCHRSLLADYLSLQGVTIIHILDIDTTCDHILHPSVRRESKQLIYDRHTNLSMDFD
ncbi:MAG: DUF488 domain-containing protein [Gammaproteobacteria bacterium]|nr:DUF488 domain-containing protein [Gammaproteobacteria bacterium]